jgi:hypothetical protein
LRGDPMFKLALERLPGARDLCSQSTISRLENLPDRRMLLRMARSPSRPAGRLRFANRIDRLPGRTPHPAIAGALATHLTPRPDRRPSPPEPSNPRSSPIPRLLRERGNRRRRRTQRI